ncbi:hypothetical protein AB0M38_08130 [Streptomyces sp. NPDC051742]|uniref:hypothetical protein n=1 Tax=unclassified Streptomyces TaxID=2593676 RepID=UPI0034350B0C
MKRKTPSHSAKPGPGLEIAPASAPARGSSSKESYVGRPVELVGDLIATLGKVVTTPRKSRSGVEASSGAWKYLPPKP